MWPSYSFITRFPHLKFQVLEMRTRNAQWCFAIFLGGIFHFATMTVSCWVHSMMNLFTHFCCHPGHGCVSFPSQLQATHLGTLMLAPRTVWIGRRRLNTRTKLLCWLGWTHQHVLKLSGATCSVHMRVTYSNSSHWNPHFSHYLHVCLAVPGSANAGILMYVLHTRH